MKGRMRITLALFFLFAAGCSTVQIPNYIKADRPYARKVYGDYDNILSTLKTVLAKEGWTVEREMSPSVYERAEQEGANADKDVLLFTNVKQHSMILYSSYTHLNIIMHAIAEGADVEIRYAKVTPLLIKQFHSDRNDPLATRILDRLEKELESK